MDVRRIVTGHDSAGRSLVVSDEIVEPVTVRLFPGVEVRRLWGSDEIAKLPTDGTAPEAPRYFPPPGGFRYAVFTLAPDAPPPAGLDMDAALAEFEQKLPGLPEVMEQDHPGMHTTDTVDFNFVLSGEAWLELDEGKEALCRAGDVVIQNGTRHAWHNRSAEPCVLVVAINGAHRAG